MAEPRARVVCVAVVSRLNRPLYLRCFGDESEELRFHHIVHSSLDIFEERRATPVQPGVQLDPYLGLLQPSVELRVYGYISNTDTKLVAILTDGEARDAELRQLFRRLHALVIDAISNPFYVAGHQLASKKFEQGVRQLATGAR
jgi:hypothetical protein